MPKTFSRFFIFEAGRLNWMENGARWTRESIRIIAFLSKRCGNSKKIQILADSKNSNRSGDYVECRDRESLEIRQRSSTRCGLWMQHFYWNHFSLFVLIWRHTLQTSSRERSNGFSCKSSRGFTEDRWNLLNFSQDSSEYRRRPNAGLKRRARICRRTRIHQLS